jgi:hypothetical protein
MKVEPTGCCLLVSGDGPMYTVVLLLLQIFNTRTSIIWKATTQRVVFHMAGDAHARSIGIGRIISVANKDSLRSTNFVDYARFH